MRSMRKLPAQSVEQITNQPRMGTGKFGLPASDPHSHCNRKKLQVIAFEEHVVPPRLRKDTDPTRLEVEARAEVDAGLRGGTLRCIVTNGFGVVDAEGNL
jgi:hypothetical protein